MGSVAKARDQASVYQLQTVSAPAILESHPPLLERLKGKVYAGGVLSVLLFANQGVSPLNP